MRRKEGGLAVLPALLSVPPSRSFAAWQRQETDDEGLRPSDHPWVAVFSFSERTREEGQGSTTEEEEAAAAAPPVEKMERRPEVETKKKETWRSLLNGGHSCCQEAISHY